MSSYRLTDAQQAMLIDSMNAPGTGLWNVQLTFTIREPLDRDKLHRCWQALLDRHTALRTRVAMKGQPTQHVEESVRFQWEEVDWTDRPPEGLPEAVDAYRARLLLMDFDFGVAPVQRVVLVRCRDRHHCIWVGHHAFVDGRSMYNLAYELGTLYHDGDLADPRPFRDYVDWNELHRQEMGEGYWRDLLHDFERPTSLGWRDERQAPGHLGGAELRLSRENTRELEAFCERVGTTLNASLQGAWGLLLHRYSGSDDVVLGSVRACRRSALPDMDAMLGQLVHTVPVRLKPTPDLTAAQLVREVRRQHLAVRDFEHASPLAIRSASSVPSGARLFETVVAFDIHSIADALHGLGGFWEHWDVTDRGRNGYGVTVFGYGGPEMLLRMEWHGAWLSDAIARRILPNLARTMMALAEAPDARVADLEILTPAERDTLLVEWRGPRVEYPAGETIHAAVQEQARRTPDVVAVRFAEQALTYLELMERVDQLSAALLVRRVTRGSRVGVCLERCLDLPAALLAVMKAGGAYVPLDPGDPVERIRFLLEDTGAAAVITTRKLAARMAIPEALALLLDAPLGPPATDVRWPEVAEDDHAYVLYTSGSTGKPKGVINAHRGAVNRLRWAQDRYDLDANDRVLQKTPFTFDVSVWEFFWPLMTGARLVIARPHAHKDMRYLNDVIEAEGITLVHFVPSVLRGFLDEVDVERCASLRQVICSGEAVPVNVQDRFLDLFDAHLDNLYGPTEAAIDVSYWRCRKEPGQRIVPMGWSVANTQLRVLDSNLRLVPIGTAGELYIGGAQVAEGYLNRAELTAQRFLSDPFLAGNRLYRTGDLVRHREDGALEFLGRVDDQVKVGGLRIELGEIESALCNHERIRDAAVIARAVEGAPSRLVGFVVYEDGGSATTTEIRRFLKEWLPAPMVPGLFLDLPRLPRLTSGKIDRKALAKLAENTAAPSRSRPPVSTDMERTVARVWSKLLRVEEPSAEDNFFELGGDSLLAMQATLAIEDVVGHRLDPRMAAFKTLRQIAAALEEALRSAPQA